MKTKMEQPKRLFNHYEAMNDNGHALFDEIRKLFSPILDDLSSEGISTRDIQLVAEGAIQSLVAEKTLMIAMEKRKKNKEIYGDLGRRT